MPVALVVDDNADLRLLIGTVLRTQGFEVIEAAGGHELLATGRRLPAPPDVVILDVQMPHIDGWDTLAALRTLPSFADVPIVLCTVKASVADRRRGWRLGCDGYLLKPFTVNDLLHEVQQAMLLTPSDRRAVRRYRLLELEDAKTPGATRG